MDIDELIKKYLEYIQKTIKEFDDAKNVAPVGYP